MKRIATLLLTQVCIAGLFAQTFVINEIDYDQSGTDNAEFIEIKNISSGPISLSGHYLLLISGGGSFPTVYDSIALPGTTVAAGGYFVVCGDSANVPNCDFLSGTTTHFIQNGGTGTTGPDAVSIHNANKTRLDVVSYEGSLTGHVEVSGNLLLDNPNNLLSGISRIPDGTDTQNNDQDFRRKCISPGAANVTADTNCVIVTSTPSKENTHGKVTISPNPTTGKLFFSASKGNPIRIEVMDWTGKTVKKAPFQRSVDLTTLPAGMYFVRTYFKDNLQVDKVILR